MTKKLKFTNQDIHNGQSNLYLCSFASDDLKKSKMRFLKEANAMNIYNDIKIFSFTDLFEVKKKQINGFFQKGQKRLFGYACWKPEIILSYLNQIPENSILQYSDIGCSFNYHGLKRLHEYCEIVDQKNILVFQYKKPDFKVNENIKFQIYYEFQYTKADAWHYFNIDNNSQILKTEQVWSGTMFFKNNFYSKKILSEWNNLSKINHLFDDSSSNKKNHTNFIEHRHDQSIFSLICKRENVYSVSASECEFAKLNNKKIWFHLAKYPILAKRDKKYDLKDKLIKKLRSIFN